ncbi:MAG TPA: hypothetical protein VFZ97_17230 [Acidimicrobiales bacterium]
MTSAVHPGGYEAENPADAESVPPRHAALMGSLARLRPARSRNFPLETVMLVLGGLLLPIGVITIIVGWYGAAHTPKLYEQNDYLISGGMLGLGLVFIGGFLYFSYWVTRQIRTTSTAAQQTLRALSRIEAQLASGSHSSNGASNGYRVDVTDTAPGAAAQHEEPVGSGRRPRRRAETEAATVTARATSGSYTSTAARQLVATERGTLVHRPDCPVVATKENLRTVDSDTPGFRPCQICNPLDH